MVEILRVGATYKPPSVSMEYNDKHGSLCYRRFPVIFAQFTDPAILGEDVFPKKKLNRFITDLIRSCPEVDLAKENKATIEMYKKQMEREFDANAIDPEDPNFVYDVQEDFTPDDEPNDWDD